MWRFFRPTWPISSSPQTQRTLCPSALAGSRTWTRGSPVWSSRPCVKAADRKFRRPRDDWTFEAQCPPAAGSAPFRQLTVPLRVSPGGLEAQLPQLGAPLHPFALQTPHVGGQDAGKPKVLQTLQAEGRGAVSSEDMLGSASPPLPRACQGFVSPPQSRPAG